MKKRNLFILTAFLCCIALVSCKKEETNNNGNNNNTNPQTTGTVINNAVTDVDGNHYNAVWIGGKLWMKENLRTTKFPDGTNIELGQSEEYNPIRITPNGDASTVSTYGYLYNWKAVMNGASSSTANPSGVQGICPNGWHVPSEAEWKEMLDYVKSQSQYCYNGQSPFIAKALASKTGWETSTIIGCIGNNQSANDALGFSAYPAGYTWGGGPGYFGQYTYFWSSTGSEESDYYYIYSPYLSNISSYVESRSMPRSTGCSVRCVRN
jgi:uncharacterized protein (TIGR02145 family)